MTSTFLKRTHHSAKLKITQDSLYRFIRLNIMALGRTCKPKRKSLPCFIIKKFREVPYQSMQFYSGSGYLKSHNNLDLEIKLMLPLKPDFSGTTYVPTSSSTRRVNSCIRGTCKAWTEQLFIISMIRAYTDFHTYELGVLFKAGNIFVFYLFILFLYLFYFIFFFLNF